MGERRSGLDALSHEALARWLEHHVIDTAEVARMLGLAQSSSVRLYRQRYADFPKPLGRLGGAHIWRRFEIEEWLRKKG